MLLIYIIHILIEYFNNKNIQFIIYLLPIVSKKIFFNNMYQVVVASKSFFLATKLNFISFI